MEGRVGHGVVIGGGGGGGWGSVRTLHNPG